MNKIVIVVLAVSLAANGVLGYMFSEAKSQLSMSSSNQYQDEETGVEITREPLEELPPEGEYKLDGAEYDRGYKAGKEDGYKLGLAGEPIEGGLNAHLTLEVFQSSKTVTKITKTGGYTTAEGVHRTLKYFINVSGELTGLSDRLFTISRKGDSLPVHIDEDASILILSGETTVSDGKTSQKLEEAEFDEINEGDILLLTIELKPYRLPRVKVASVIISSNR